MTGKDGGDDDKNNCVIPAEAGNQFRRVRNMQPAVYIMANRKHGTLYIGVTGNLATRIWQHKQGDVAGFTKRYGIKSLVWAENHETMESAIMREKQMKKWNRAWKIELIEQDNPDWTDLYKTMNG